MLTARINPVLAYAALVGQVGCTITSGSAVAGLLVAVLAVMVCGPAVQNA